MKYLTSVRQIEQREAEPRRQAFRDEFTACWLCKRPAVDIHEMTPGAGRRRGFQERATWIRTCRLCHATSLQPFLVPYSLAGQLALKALRDPEWYDRELVLAIRGKAPTAVTEPEVVSAALSLAI